MAKKKQKYSTFGYHIHRNGILVSHGYKSVPANNIDELRAKALATQKKYNKEHKVQRMYITYLDSIFGIKLKNKHFKYK